MEGLLEARLEIGDETHSLSSLMFCELPVSQELTVGAMLPQSDWTVIDLYCL